MPSMIIGNISGGVNILSGYGVLYSGARATGPVGGVQLVWSNQASGALYVALSGGITITSGGVNNFSGAMDGLLIQVGGNYFVPRVGIGGYGPLSGSPQIFVATDAASSGQGRLFWEIF